MHLLLTHRHREQAPSHTFTRGHQTKIRSALRPSRTPARDKPAHHRVRRQPVRIVQITMLMGATPQSGLHAIKHQLRNTPDLRGVRFYIRVFLIHQSEQLQV